MRCPTASSTARPVYLALDDFDEVKASVLQVTRSPGKKVVYLGCLLLVLGVFSMFYIRERRIWVWVKHGAGRRRACADGDEHPAQDARLRARIRRLEDQAAAIGVS